MVSPKKTGTENHERGVGSSPPAKTDLFVGREELLTRFEHYVRADRDRPPPVTHVHGIGGQGKSALLRHLRDWCRDRRVPYVLIDFDSSIGSSRLADPADALLAIAAGLAATGLGPFYRRFALLRGLIEVRRSGQKLSPAPGPLTRTAGPLVDAALAMADTATAGLGIPVAKLAWQALENPIRKRTDPAWSWVADAFERKGWQERWDAAEISDLYDLLAEALAEDLEALFRKGGKYWRRQPFCRPVVLLDTFENAQMTEFIWGDAPFRQLAEHTHAVMLVVAGRNKLDWGGTELLTDDRLVQVRLGNLSREECHQYLSQRLEGCFGRIDDRLENGLFRITRGFPLALALATDFLAELLKRNEKPLALADFQSAVIMDLPPPLLQRLRRHLPPRSHDLLKLGGDRTGIGSLMSEIMLNRLLREVSPEDLQLIRRSCVPRYVTEGVLQALWPDEEQIVCLRRRLCRHSFVHEDYEHGEERSWAIHSVVRRHVLASMADWPGLANLHERLDGHWKCVAERASHEDTRFGLQVEAIYHRMRHDEQRGCEDAVRMFNAYSYSSVTHRHRASLLLAAFQQHGATSTLVDAARLYMQAVNLRNRWVNTGGKQHDPRPAALDLLRRSLRRQRGNGPTVLLASTQLAVAVIFREQAELRRAHAWLRKARATAEGCSDAPMQARSALYLAGAEWRGNPDFCNLSLIDQAEALFLGIEGYGMQVLFAVIEARVSALSRSGQAEAALAEARRGYALWQSYGKGYAGFLFLMPELLMDTCSPTTKIAGMIEEIRELLDQLGSPHSIMETTYVRILAAFESYQGNYQQALELLRHYLARQADVHASRAGVARAFYEMGRCVAELGDYQMALAYLRVAAGIWHRIQHVDYQKALQEAEGMCQSRSLCVPEAVSNQVQRLTRRYAPWLLSSER